MSKDIQNYINKYSDEIKQLFMKIREQIMESIPCEAEERLWAKLPSYYVDNKFVRLICFKQFFRKRLWVNNSYSMYYSFFLKNPF